jgi:DNA-binding NarL/FixJ family response regulator
MFAQVLANLISSQFGFEVTGVATSMGQAIGLLDERHPDLLILDLDLGDGSGLALLESLQDRALAPAVIVVSAHVSSFFCPLHLRPLVAGVIDKSQAYEAIVAVINQMLCQRGVHLPTHTPATVHTCLTARERDVFALLGKGLSSKQIATALGLSVRTVETHRKHIASKTGMSGSELMHLAILAGQTASAGQSIPV